jgi:hypothetical protein
MNLVGKIFIVVLLVMGVVYMAFAMAVYATHKNWREAVFNEQATPDKPLGLAKQLKDLQDKNRQLTDEKEKEKQKAEADRAAMTQAIAKLENELDTAKKALARLDAQQAELEKAKREAVAAMNSTQNNATNFQKELTGQRTNIEDARKDRDSNFKEVVRLSDALNQEKNERDLLKKKTDELAKDLAKAKQVLRKFGLDESKDYSNVPPPVDGQIMATPGGGLVEISIGADQGLMKGHQLEVYRIGGGQSTYVGRIEVVKAAPDKAVCKIDPKFQNSNMMVGDRVASKIE